MLSIISVANVIQKSLLPWKEFRHKTIKTAVLNTCFLIKQEFSCLRSFTISERNMSLKNSDKLIWVDLEMTGLDVETDTILEMACIVTDGDLNIVAEKGSLIIHHPDDVLNRMGEWCTEHHGKSGLTAAVRSSNLSMVDVENDMLQFIESHSDKGTSPLAGNTVYVDKKFLERYMPNFVSHLHYRIVDVSTVKELCRRWYPNNFADAPKKTLSHRALDDIRQSIAELKYYKKTIFKDVDL